MLTRIALLGCGHIAGAHAQAALELDARNCSIVALGDACFERAEVFATNLGLKVPIFSSAEALLKTTKPDAVIICTPPATHFALAHACLKHGVAVLCEKPLVTEVAAGRTLCQEAAARRLVLRTATKYRFCEGVVAAQKCLQSGRLGRVHRAKIAFGAPLSSEHRWLFDAAQSGGGVLMDNGPHAVDLARFLFGDVRLMEAELRSLGAPDIEKEARLQLASHSGVEVQIELSWLRSMGQTFLQILGKCGSIDVRWDVTVWRDSNGTEQILAPGYNKKHAFERQMKTFLTELAIEADPQGSMVWSGEDGLRALEIIAPAYERERSIAQTK